MKKNYSNIFSLCEKIIRKTVNSLRLGNIVALPTETVYGLAGNAYSLKALKTIYKLKKRPKKNPLIIHYYNLKMAKNDVVLNDNFIKLYKKFCPGPITFVLKKNQKSKIKTLANANQDTVAIRFPNHRVIKSILKKINFPLAMPSANISSNLSPVSALDVFDEFKNKIKIIINGGKSKVGIESTVVDLTAKPRILRPGIITLKNLKRFISINHARKNFEIKSPGLLKKHYSPGIPVILNKKPNNIDYAFIILGKKYKMQSNYFNLSKKADLKEAASNLYKTMRKIKKSGYKKIFVMRIPNIGPGIAINDRLKRASK